MGTANKSSSSSVTVLHLSSERTWRGGEQQIAYLIDELKLLGVIVHIAVKAGSEFEKYCKGKGMPCYSLPFRNSLDLRTALEIKKICRDLNPDLIHLHSSKSHGIGVLSAILGNKVPLVLSRRVDFVPKNTWLTRMKYNYPGIKRILCVSHKIRDIMKAYLREPEKAITIHSGVDLAKFNIPVPENTLRKEFNVDRNTVIIGNTSALEDHKDYFTFIDTIYELIQRRIPLKAFIIGTGSREAALKEYAAEKKLTEAVCFTGFRKDIVRVLPSLDLFLITSNEEGLGTSVLDAFAAGIPVVATAAGGIPEMVINNETGMLASVGDKVSLADAVVKLLSDPALKDRLIRNAKDKVKDFSKEETARKTLTAYQEILT